MTPIAHCAVFWFTGLVAGVLLGWMQARRASEKGAGVEKGARRTPASLRVVNQPTAPGSARSCS